MNNKKQIWEKLGIIIKPSFTSKWMASHVAVPFAEHLNKNIFKVYFCVRDKKNRSHVTYSIIDLKKLDATNKIHQNPILKPGNLGTFDDNGVTPSWIIKHNKKKFLFYVGWNTGGNTRMSLFAGLAKYDKNKFKRVIDSPILERNKFDPFLTATSCVLKDKGKFKMWYVSGDSWSIKNNETFPKYNIKYAESKDCINWERRGRVCIDYKSKHEFALARPSILKYKNKYLLWYSYKSFNKEYKIGFADSKNGYDWKRQDEKINFSPKKNYKWENEMQTYPHVFKHKNELYMLYNGNGYGKTGVALAKLKNFNQ